MGRYPAIYAGTTRPERAQVNFGEGYWPTAGLVGSERVPNSIRDGQNFLMLGPGLLKTAKGLLATTQTGGQRLYLVGSTIQVVTGSGTGSVVPYINDSFWYVTSGSQAIINNITAADTAGKLKYQLGGVEYTAGLTAPPKLVLNASSGPAISVSGTAGVLTGDYAVVYTKVRSQTGAESNGSPPSDVVSTSGKAIQILFPTPDPGQDMWGIYVTDPGLATTGPFNFLKNVPSSQGSVLIDFTPAQTENGLEPPTDNDPPPVGKFVANIGPIMVVLGTFGGANTGVFAGVSPSKSNNAEAFPAGFTTFLNPPETVIGFAARPTEGELILWTANSLQSLLYTGSAEAPIVSRALWPLTGILSPHGGCFADSQFYGFSGPSGPVRLGPNGDPDSRFAQPVREKMRLDGWDPTKVVVGWDSMEDAVVYMFQNTAIAYMRSIDKWSPPVNLNVVGTVESCITVGGQLFISMHGPNGSGLFKWEQGTVAQSAYIIFAWMEEPNGQDRKTITGYRATFNGLANNVTCDLLLDLDDTPVVNASLTTTAMMGDTIPKQSIWKRLNKRCRYYTLKISTMGADKYIYDAQFSMLYEGNVREKK